MPIKEYIIKSKKSKEEYSVVLCIENEIVIPEKTTCTCKHGSFYRFTQRNLALKKWKCRHLISAIEKYKRGEPDEIEKAEKDNLKIKSKPFVSPL